MASTEIQKLLLVNDTEILHPCKEGNISKQMSDNWLRKSDYRPLSQQLMVTTLRKSVKRLIRFLSSVILQV